MNIPESIRTLADLAAAQMNSSETTDRQAICEQLIRDLDALADEIEQEVGR